MNDGIMKQAPQGLSGARLGPKPWDECTDAEKIERLKEQMQGWIRACADLRDRLDALEGHEHNAKGEIVVNLRDHRHRSAMGVAQAAWNPFA